MSSSDSWTLIGLTILVVLLLFYLSKKMICGSNGNSGDSGESGSGRNSIASGHNHHHQHNRRYFEEDIPPEPYNNHHHHQPFYSEFNPTLDHQDNPHHEDQNSEHRLNLDYNSNQQIGEDGLMNRPYYYYPHHHYHNLPHYPSQSVSLRELLEICSSRSNSVVSTANNQQQHHQPTFPSTATVLPGNYRTNTSSSDNQHCHDPSLEPNNAAASDSGLVEVSVISDTTSSSTPPCQTDSEPTAVSPTTIELTERKKQLIEKQLRTQIVRMIQAEREVRRLAHLLSLQQGLAVESPGVPASNSAAAAEATSLVDREHEPYYISEERLPPSSPNNSSLHSHHPNYSGHNEVILSAHALTSRYPHHLIRGGRSDHHHYNHHLNQHHPQLTLTHDGTNNSRNADEESANHEELPPPPYEDCVPSSAPPS